MISVIVPVYRDAAVLARTLAATAFSSSAEVIVCRAYDDESIAALRRTYEDARLKPSRYDGSLPPFCSATALAERLRWVDAQRGRARQMNAGAAVARGEWLLFLHADTTLPHDWTDAIAAAAKDPRVVAGCFRFALDSRSAAARVIEWGVRLRVALFTLPYGDQALFVRRDVFEALGGYADLPIMEDVDFVRRARARGRLFCSPLPALTSARRWEQDGWAARTARHLALIALYFCGVAPAALVRFDPGRRAHPAAPRARMSL